MDTTWLRVFETAIKYGERRMAISSIATHYSSYVAAQSCERSTAVWS
jgi:hypothetical protein